MFLRLSTMLLFRKAILMDEVGSSRNNGNMILPITHLLKFPHLRPFMDIQLLVSHTFCKISPKYRKQSHIWKILKKLENYYGKPSNDMKHDKTTRGTTLK